MESILETLNESKSLDQEILSLPASNTIFRSEINDIDLGWQNRIQEWGRLIHVRKIKRDEEATNGGLVWKIGNIYANIAEKCPK